MKRMAPIALLASALMLPAWVAVGARIGVEASPVAHSVLPSGRFCRLVVEFKSAGEHRVAIHDAAGHRVRLLRDQPLPAGRVAVRWDGRDDAARDLPAGRYWVRVDDVYVGTCLVVR